MTKTFTTVDGLTHACDSEITSCGVRDPVDGKPTMKLFVVGVAPHVFVFGVPADMCDEVADHTIDA